MLLRGLVLTATAGTCMVGCSQPTDAQPFPGSCSAFEAIQWSPPGMAEDVPTNTGLGITFSDYPDPDTVNAASLLLTTGIFWHTGLYRVDLVTKTVHFRTPTALRPRLGYTVTVFPPLHSLQGCPTSFQQRSFRTGEQPAPSGPDPPATPFATVLPILASSCGGAGCHHEALGSACLATPAKGLSLCDSEAYDALVGVPSREVSRLKLVVPHDSSRSYLLRKLLSPEASGPPVPTTLGHRDPPGGSLEVDQLRTIANWIDTGAVR